MYHASWYALVNIRLSSALARTSRKNWASVLTESIPASTRNLRTRFDVIKTESTINRINEIGFRNLQIEVVVKPLYISCINNGQEATVIFANYPSFVFLRNVARRRYSAPIAQLGDKFVSSTTPQVALTYKCVPDCNMSNIRMPLSNLAHCLLQSLREAFFICFEIEPCPFGLLETVIVLLHVNSFQLIPDEREPVSANCHQ